MFKSGKTKPRYILELEKQFWKLYSCADALRIKQLVLEYNQVQTGVYAFIFFMLKMENIKC